MKKYNVLVTAISGDVANSILKCFQNADIINELYGCDIYQYPCGLNKVKKSFQVVPCKQEVVYLQQLLDICCEYSIDVIVPSNEHEIKCISKNRGIFLDNGIRCLIHEESVYDVFFNKMNTIRLLEQLNLPAIPTFYADEYADELEYPILVKDTFGSGSKSVTLVNSQKEYSVLGDLGHHQIVQKYIGSLDREYTVPVFSSNGGKNIHIIPFKRKLSTMGYTSFIEPVDGEVFEKIRKICHTVASKVNLYGSIDLQMREENGQFYIFECNPRLSGTVHFRHMLGFSDAIWWLKYVLNSETEFIYISQKQKYVGIRELNEEIVWLN